MEKMAKYKKPGKYLPILHEATCDDYFFVKMLVEIKRSKSYLTYYIDFA